MPGTCLGAAVDIADGAIGVGSVAYLLLALAYAVRFRPARPRAPGCDLPAISVLKPLHGDEPLLYECLHSFCVQDYPGEFQVVFGVADPDDPAARVVERLIRDLPGRDLVLVRGTAGRGANRKVANLLGMLPAARHALLALSDSDVMLAGPDHLAATVAALDTARPGKGLPIGAVTCLYHALPLRDAASRLAAMHIDHHFLTSALVALRLGPPDTCYGKLTVLRRTTLEAAGGLDALADQVADDAELGWMLRRAGFGVRVLPLLVRTVVSETPASLWRHELRWARTVRSTEPAGHAMTLITHAFPVLSAVAVLHPGLLAAMLPLAALALRTALHRVMARRLGVGPAPVWRIAGRETLCFAVWLASYVRWRVEWQGTMLTLGPRGRLAARTQPSGRGDVALGAAPAVEGARP